MPSSKSTYHRLSFLNALVVYMCARLSLWYVINCRQQYTSSASLQSAIMSAAYQNAGTVTGAALDFVRTSVLVPVAGYRGGHAAVLVVTDGNSQDSVQSAADMLKAVAAVHAVGVGQEISVS